ncbi:uncharacterized protein LOC108093584 [Drosophila ficusphila]|uniref:uncharacterized protein LOC108093584 n=1 Tax=Drosophila ficusphila TaxID=30025 RepID=UPI0007E7040E|nr:uncharacterized protein LOC108093584 [Drosophila ficusphila]
MSTAQNSAEPADLALLVGSNNKNGSRSRSGGTPRKYATAGAASSIRMFPASQTLNTNNDQSQNQLKSICQQAQAGHKLMVIMRGPPGSGKSTLAESVLRQARLLEKHHVRDFVFSSDDYFWTRHGYEFNPTLLPAAHEWNQQRVSEKAARGWSPIFVDNTNTMVWEMQPYVKSAVRHGYVLELLEPQTSWCKSASKLAQKNVHQVPRESIQRMLERYERTTAADLIQLLKETKYTVDLPQMRQHPPLPSMPVLSSFKDKPLETRVPEPKQSPVALNANAQSWVPYEQGAPCYWSQTANSTDVGDSVVAAVPSISDASASATSEVSLIELLRDESKPEKAPLKSESGEQKPLQKHCLDCQNEPAGFSLLRQMYPNKQLTGLWDLFVKCQADVDWAVDILLKEDELNAASGSDQFGFEESGNAEEAAQFECDCDKSVKSQELPPPFPSSPTLQAAKTAPKQQRQPRNKRTSAPTNKELQIQIENCFVLGDEQYSEHTRKIRDLRNGILDQPIASKLPDAPEEADQEEPDEEDPEDNTLLEMDLGASFIEQLRAQFHTDDEILPPEQELPLATKVFVPRQLAKQLYMLWMEAVYNQLEEQRQQTLRDDEQFARLLKHPGYADCSESPSNVGELLDMELAWSIYNSEQLAAKQAAELAARNQPPNDIATHLTKMKLCEAFPDIPNDTVLEIFAATGSNYGQTVEVLDSNAQSSLSGAELYEKALREGEKLSTQVAMEEQKLQQQRQLQQNSSSQGQRASSSSSSSGRSPLMHEEAKCAALRDFEETRNMAAHHSQLKAECYLKAKEAVQRGNGSVALYYSEIAKLHKQKIDVFNQRAANCIMEVHRHTQNNPDLLDLHYLHAIEAISCLDLFLDRHITVLRNSTRVYKHVFIITGRGLHSANGVSTIKIKVKSRLGERRLRWQEVNPGLLRVKVFSASRHSKNF